MDTFTTTKEFISKYELNPHTMALIARHDQKGNIFTHIIEEEGEYNIDQLPRDLIDEACVSFGSDLEGRQGGTAKICGYTYKIPISIEPGSGMYFLPTFSPSREDCSWINHSYVLKVEKYNNTQSKLTFFNEKSVILDVSHNSMMNQVLKTAQYRFLLEKRIKKSTLQNLDFVKEFGYLHTYYHSLLNSLLRG